MKSRSLLVLCCSMLFCAGAYADIYKRVDENGHVTYSSIPLKGARKLHLEPLPTMVPPGRSSNAENSSDFRVNPETQGRRDNARRKILEDELATEQKALEDARIKLKEGQDAPEVYRTASGQTFRNVAKYDEKVKALQEDVDSHEKNIEALKTELSNLK
ncbi:DUF4124 domain-containing protein [Sideroxydans lithotrophicus]|uniref:DUF4124 domain-containing protein n=1 Tax=Sideroxydans lithotrophicus (strain ES-1) TaxID=580332 RepID=D5CQC8_SIDLE|nr:DUF4124 domain-containing protein [Sideroxydans lithotrophicus]ADE13149.1 conserved hypothetical protein [Sideroxydans lithotrophicus ES-1]